MLLNTVFLAALSAASRSLRSEVLVPARLMLVAITLPFGATVMLTLTLPEACSFSLGLTIPSGPGERPSRLNDTPTPSDNPASELPCIEPLVDSSCAASPFLLIWLPLLKALAIEFWAALRASSSLRSCSLRSASSFSFWICSGVFSCFFGVSFFGVSGGKARLSSLSCVINGSLGAGGAGCTGTGWGTCCGASLNCAFATSSTSTPIMTSTPVSGRSTGGVSTRK